MSVRTLVSWSSGKDSAWMLHVLRSRPDVEVVGLFTSINSVAGRVSMHGVRAEVLRKQAESVGLPLTEIALPYPCSNEEYAASMKRFVATAEEQKVEAFAFGDLFLEDVRRYREDQLAGTGIEAVFPLWGSATSELSDRMIEAGLEATVVCMDPRRLPTSFAGASYDRSFVESLPEGVDPCGENGEFHTLALGGPMFRRPLSVRSGIAVERDGFLFVDMLPEG